LQPGGFDCILPQLAAFLCVVIASRGLKRLEKASHLTKENYMVLQADGYSATFIGEGNAG
jgi:hypothetical protein